MSLVLGALGERIRGFLNGRQALPLVSINPTVQPVLSVERIVEDHFIRRKTVSVTAASTYALTSALKDKDVRVRCFDLDVDAGFDAAIIMTDDEGNTVSVDPTGMYGQFFTLDAGWQLKVVTSNFSQAGNVTFDAEYFMYQARSDAGVP